MADDASSTSSGIFGTGISGGTALGLGALGIGAGLMLGQGEQPLPWEFGQLTSQVPQLQSQGATLFGEGQTLFGQGTSALAMAQAGELTAPQQAVLAQEKQGLQNQAIQTYANMGRAYGQDTSSISTQANIDAQVNAQAQQMIQTTIQLGMNQLSAGGSMTQSGLAYTTAADQALITAGNAQIQQDKNYSDSLSNVFKSIATVLGGGLKLAAL